MDSPAHGFQPALIDIRFVQQLVQGLNVLQTMHAAAAEPGGRALIGVDAVVADQDRFASQLMAVIAQGELMLRQTLQLVR